LARGATADDDTLLLHALSVPAGQARSEVTDGVRVVADLPGPDSATEWSPRWALDRSTMLRRRIRGRQALIEHEQPDIVHLHLLHYMLDAFALRSLGRRPLVSTVHDVTPHHHRLPAQLERALLRRTYEHAGRIVVYHDYLRRRLVAEHGVDPARVRVIPHPVRPRRPRNEVAENRPFTVLFFGAFRRNKGIAVLLEAVNQLRDLPDLRFVFAGRGVASLEQLVTDAAAHDSRVIADVRFVPDRDRDSLYAGADLVVLPYTEFESQSGVVADAYSYGVPVLGTDVGALGPTLRDDGTGWVVAPDDAPALADAIQAIARDSAGRAARAEAMVRLVDERSEANTGRAFRALYTDVLGC
jgi:glycosyltransferase involved in cell wall biosynthesis